MSAGELEPVFQAMLPDLPLERTTEWRDCAKSFS
jgi:hypothetical protein